MQSILNKRKTNWKLAPFSFHVTFFVYRHKFKIDAKQFPLPARRVYWLESVEIRWYCYICEGKFRHCSTEKAYPQAGKTSQGEGCGNIAGLAQISTDTINHWLRDPYHL